ncbi:MULTISPECIES: catalase family protein [Asaia]|uniref:catalase family protein n=1 Tax=Asaia TaxID=91914 RepID=UPI002FC284DB
MRPPVAYDDSLEKLRSDEEAVKAGLRKTFRKIITATRRDLGHASRGVHAKSHALLEGTLHVRSGLPPELAQGLFARPGSYRITARLSAIPGDPLRDGVSGPRGFALKIHDVPGDLLDDTQSVAVQDFLFANGPAFGAPHAGVFLKMLRLLALTTDRAEGAKALLSRVLRFVQDGLARFARRSAALDALGGFAPTHPLGDRFHSQVPSRYGDYVAKFDIVPESESFRRLTGRRIDIDHDPIAIRRAVGRVLAQEGGSMSLRVQLCRDLATQPIENAQLAWSEETSPFQCVASLDFPPQKSWSEEKSRQVDDSLSFSPWHGLVAHRPLGNIMRARRVAYPFSATLRAGLNGCPMRLLPEKNRL